MSHDPTPTHPTRDAARGHDAAVTSPTTPTGQPALAAAWRDDLLWYRQAYRPAKVRWLPERIADLATSATGGQLDFTTLADLALLSRYQQPLHQMVAQLRAGATPLLDQARDVLGGPGWIPVAHAVDMTPRECAEAVDSAWRVAVKAEARAVIGRALAIARGPYTNPLVQLWELRQMWLGYEAAAAILEDALCALVVELKTSHPLEDLALAAGEKDVAALEMRIYRARRERRGPDGQPVSWPPAASPGSH